MKTRALLPLLALILASVADEPSPQKEQIDGWGTALNPAGDCKIKAEAGKLTITVPGSAKPHDLSPELLSITAPRVVQPVKGDFVVQVKVDGEFQPGGESTEIARSGYTGAGLVVMADERNFVRIERATLQFQGDEPHPYTNFEIRVNGELERGGTTADLPTDRNKPTWLRLERKGDQVLGAMSHDGIHWTYGEPKYLRDEAWSHGDVRVGVAAVSTSLKPFTPQYSEFSIKQGDQQADEKIEAK